MNKHCYRLIFSRTHGELRVVSELARSCSSEPGQSRGGGTPRLWVTLRRSVWLLGLALFAGPAVAGGIVADGGAAPGQRPEVIATQNGLPQVNITAPNQAGVSHNQYRQFDVDQKGAILNNSAVMTSTQLAGMVQGNPNLNPNAAPARVILNEVNSNNPSQLRGFLEVAGGKAQVIVANPAGIVCNGCGTINAGRMTLTTGKPQMNADGSLAGYRVERGVVRVEGGGLNGDVRHDTEYVDILARAVEVNAGVWAKEGIAVVAGRNRVSADGKTAVPLADDGSAKPELAIDMGQMGGMYSGQIRMIGTESGVGVRNQNGQVQAGKTLTVSSEGKLSWQSTAQDAVTRAGGDISLAAKDTIEYQGKLHSGGALKVQSREGEVTQSGTLAAAGDLQVTAARGIQSSGHLLAGSDANSQIVREADLTLASQGDIRASGSLLSKKDVKLTGRQIDISQASLAAGRATLEAQGSGVAMRQAKVDGAELAISTAGDIDAQHAQVRAGRWQVDGNNLFNQQGAWSQTGDGESRFTLAGKLDNSDGGIESRQLDFKAAALTNQRGRLVALDNAAQHWRVGGLLDNNGGELGSNGDLSLDAGSLDNQAGTVKSVLALNLEIGAGINNAAGSLLAGKNLTLEARGTLDNQAGNINGGQLSVTAQRLNNAQGQLISQGALLLTAREGLDNRGGLLGADTALEIHTDGNWDNRGGTAQSEKQLTVAAQNIDNGDGKLLSGQQLTLNAAGAVDNRGGEISGEAVNVDAQRLGNVQGKLIGLQGLDLNARQGIDNQGGLLAAGDRLTVLTEGEMNNRDGTAQGGKQLTVTAQQVDNAAGKLLSGQQLTLNATGALGNREGEISGESLTLTAQQVENTQGKVVARQDMSLTAQQGLVNTGGWLEADNALFVNTGEGWDNRGGTAQGGRQVTATAHTLDNTGGRLQSGGDLRLDAAGDILNRTGKLTAQQALDIRGSAASLFDNDGGSLQSGGDLSVRGGQLTNRAAGVVFGGQTLSLNLTGGWDNRGGTLTGNGNTLVRAAELHNARGVVNALGSLDMAFTGALDNAGGRVFSKLSQVLQAQDIFNMQGWMGSQGGWSAVSGGFDNGEGSVQSQQDAVLAANWLNNAKGVLQAGAGLALRVANDIENRAGKVSAQGQLDVRGAASGSRAGNINNAGGQWLAGDTLKFAALGMDNSQGGLLYSQKQLMLNLAGRLDNRQGKLQSGEALQLDAQTLNNADGTIDGQQQLALRILGALNNAGGAVRSNGEQQIAAAGIDNRQGVFSSRGGLALTTARLDNAAGTLISQGSGSYSIGTLNNQQGKVHSGAALTLDGEQVNNQGGQLVSTDGLTLRANQLDNSGQGTVSSQAALDVQADRLNNRDGGMLLGTTHTGVTARDIDNAGGRLQSAGTLALAGVSALDNRQGRVIANGALDVNAGQSPTDSPLALLNQGGQMQSGGALTLHARTLDNQNGTLLGLQALTLSAQQDYTRQTGETVSSNGTVTFSLSGVFTNLADWLLPGNLVLNAAGISNPAILVGKGVQLTTGALQNSGRIEADTMTLNVDTLDNTAALMGDDITVSGRVIDNHGQPAVIAATQGLTLQTGERLTNRDGALIYSGGGLRLSSDDLIENRASFIEADGDVTLEARRLDNLREGLEIQRDAEKRDYKWHRYNYYWRSYGEDVNTDVSTMAPTTQQLTFRNDDAAQGNRYGTLLAIDASGKRAQVRVKDHRGQLTDLWVNYLALVPNTDGSYAMTFYETRGQRQKAVPTPYQNTVWWNATDSEKVELWDPERFIDIGNVPYVTDYNNLRERTATGTVTTDKLVSEGVGARILAGGNMVLRITGQLLNDASVITANGNLTQDGGGRVDNRGYSVNERRQEYIVDHYDRAEGHWYPTFSRDETTALTTVDGVITGNGNVSIQGASITNTTVNQAQISQLEAALKAVDAERAEYERNPLAFTVEGAARPDGDTQLTPGSQITQPGTNPSSPIGRPLLPAELALTAMQHLDSVATNIPDNGLFSQHTAVGSPFLVVTDDRFTRRDNFISSDYLLARVGYDPAQAHKRLGDGFYEQRLVREQVLALTGKPSVKGWDAMEQYQQLMNNGVKVAEDFHLEAGVALTPAQIAALQQDIVWLVSETVQTADGPQTVWVPKVYLAQTTLRLTGDGALIGGGNLQLSADSINNAGNLFADQALNIDAGQFLHQGGDIKAGSIDVQADSLTMSTNLQDALRQATMSADDIRLSGTDIALTGAKLDATNALNLSARNDLSITAAKSSHTANLAVISGSMGNRTRDGMEEAGSRLAQLSGEWRQAQGSELNAGGNLNLSAGRDVAIVGSQANASGSTRVQAGGDINIKAETATNKSHLEANSRTSSVSNSREEDRLTLSSLSGDRGVTLVAGNNLLAEGAQVDSQEGRVGLSAQNVTIKEARGQTEDRDSEQKREGKTNSRREVETARDEVVGSTFSGRDGVTVIGREGDVTVTGSTLHSEQGGIALQAKNDVTLNTATERESRYSEERSEKKGFLNKSSGHTVTDDRITREKGTLLSGDSVSITAGNDLTVSGSAIAADRDVNLQAGNNIAITAATETESHYLLEEKKKSGLLGSGGIGFTVGSQSSRHQVDESGTTQSQSVSTVGSSQGNVNITAGNQLHIGGADLVAGKDLSLSGSSVLIDPGYDQRSREEKFESKQSGLTLALSGTVGSALNTAVSTAQQANKEGDGRLSALQGTKAALSGVQAVQAGRMDAAKGNDPSNNNTVGVSLSYGSQSSSSTQTSGQSAAQGSSLQAGNTLSIRATEGDITVRGSQLQAGKDLNLDAARDVNLLSAKNTEYLDGKNESQGGTVGVGIGVGSGGWGISVSASVNKGQGSESGNGTTHSETTVNAGHQVNIISGRDTTLKGAQVTGETVKADVGRNLTLTSEQDSDRYDAKQQSASAGGSFTFGSMTGSGSVNVSQDKLHSNFDSVQEQTGIFAGKGGFDIHVGEHTQLDGAVIGSTATADKNRLDTGTLGFTDIHNQADFKTEHQSAGFSSGGAIGSQFAGNAANNLLVGANNEGHASSTTQSAVSDGAIIIRDQDKQQQNVDDLSRDVEHANQTLSPIFDKEKEQNRLKTAQLIGEVGSQAADIARTEGDIRSLTAGKAELAAKGEKEPGEGATKAQWKDYNDKVQATDSYKAAQKQWGTGSAIQQGISAATAAVQGLAGGDLHAAVAGGLSPYLAEQIHKLAPDEASRAMAHAVVGAVVAQASGNSAAAGAAGAVSGELMAQLVMSQLYPGKSVNELTEDQKQTITTLGTLAAGLAGGLAGSGTADAVVGAQAGQNSATNNFLSSKDVLSLHKELETADKTGADKQDIYEKYAEISKKNREEAVAEGCSGNPFCANGALSEAGAGTDIANSLKRLSVFSNLSNDDLVQLDRFVLAENEDSARAIYQAMPDYVKVALNGKEAVEAIGLGAAVGGKALAALGVIGKAGKIPAVDPSAKIATGQTVGAFEKSLVHLPPGERVAIIKQTAPKVAAEYGMVKDSQLTKKNGGREVYRGQDGNLYALDTQHARFEVVTPKGKHLGEVDFSMQKIPNSLDKSGGHDLKVK
ncbi:hemagglutinin repeat-containing protein [Serratia sp. root2]|uniref:hemagglutinin repeat-containing protein n=1 Tax=Serratia sp. root2 TaxID=3059676 RepID=UPI00288EDCFF|nr:hemagglutinin repeat-containing protein [Serratia sp. root2]MDT3252731.1 hemagglutinin repeat-containing protein [Serratia sp. root2]